MGGFEDLGGHRGGARWSVAAADVTVAPLSVSLDVTAIPPRPAGAGQYALEIASALDHREDVAVTLVTRRADGARWRARAPGSRVVSWAPEPRPLRLVWEQVGLPRRLRSLPVSVHHGLHYTMPERTRLPAVVTVHDLTYFDHPEWHEPAKVRFFRRAIEVAARRAAALVCVSDSTAERLEALCHPVAPVIVAPHGIDRERFTTAEPEPSADSDALRALGIDPDRPLVVFVGTLEPRKGVATLVAAFDRVAGRHPDALLVLAGQPGWGNELDALSAAAHRDRVVVTGYVPDPAVPALLRSAAAVAYPSLDEGFGMPAFEALACGAPLVTTAGTPMATALGEAALLVEPGSVDQLADAIDGLLSGDPKAAARREVGLTRVAGLTWEASAALHAEAYRIAAAR
jgi:glycosyltransferase involved in cell wall biosynthesis